MYIIPRWRHQMETFTVLLALCEGNPPVTGGFLSQRPVTRNLDVVFDLRPNKRISKQSRCRWFETPSCSLWRHFVTDPLTPCFQSLYATRWLPVPIKKPTAWSGPGLPASWWVWRCVLSGNSSSFLSMATHTRRSFDDDAMAWNTSRVIGPLCGESTGHRCHSALSVALPLCEGGSQRDSDAELC